MKNISTLLKAFVTTSLFCIVFAISAVVAQAYAAEQTDASTTSATILWEAPGNSACYYIGWGETAAKAEKMVKSKENKISGDYSSYIIKGLEPGKKYYVYLNSKVDSTGIVEKVFEDLIVQTAPKKVTGVKLAKIDYALGTATVTWNAQDGAAGYEYILKDNSGKTVKNDRIGSGTESIISLDINNDTYYTIKVRGFFNKFGRDIYGDWSATTTFAGQPDFTKAEATSKGLSLKWGKVKGAKNYTLYVSNSANSGYKKIATTSKNSYSLKEFKGSKINKNTKYYVYIIANKTVGKKTVKSYKARYISVKGSEFDLHVFE